MTNCRRDLMALRPSRLYSCTACEMRQVPQQDASAAVS
jgi:hypothetical protein